MPNTVLHQVSPALQRGMVVKPVAGLIGVPAPHGTLVFPERLGPGIIEKIAPNGRVRVRWLDAELDAWMDPEEVQPHSGGTHIISVYHADGEGHYTRLHHHLIDGGLGCAHNWWVELRPYNIIRTVRDDGSAWTFRLNTHPSVDRVSTIWPEQPPDDDAAEALMVADLAVS
jgi:hypothetical protein